MPYTKGLSETFKNICSKHGIQMHFKEAKTIRDLLVTPKDKDTIFQESGFLYRYNFEGWTEKKNIFINLG